MASSAAALGLTWALVLCAQPAAAQQQSAAAAPAPDAAPEDKAPPDRQTWAVHGQLTNIWQYHPGFSSAFQGPQSFDHRSAVNETIDATLYAGAAPWSGGEFWVNYEINQGFAPSDTHGVAGYVNGEGAKVGHRTPYTRFQRVFFRQTIDLGGKSRTVDADLNQLAGTSTEDSLIFTAGKFDVTDVFDVNKYANEPRKDFLNWALVNTGSFDYASDAWGYTYGASLEWASGDWTTRAGFFDLSTTPNATALTPDLSQFQLDGELERRFKLWDRDGKIAVTLFQSHGRMGTFGDALVLAKQTGETPDTAGVRHFATRSGIAFNLEQSLTDDIGLFARGGIDEAGVEPYEYTDIDRTIAGGISVSGKIWSRDDDTIGLAGVTNWIGRQHIAYLASGGLGIIIGDGALPRPAPEEILEAYYNFAAVRQVHLTFDTQLIDNPAYNAERGPVIVIGARLHAEI